MNSGPFLSGLNLRNYFPSFVDSQAVYASFSAPTFDPTLGGVFPAATAKDWIKFFDGTSPHVVFTAPCPSGSTTGCAVNPLSGVAWSGSQFVAVGGNGTIVTSSDGITWTPRTSGYNSLSGVTWSGSQFVAVDRWNGTILTSPDGITWTSHSTGTQNTSLNGVTWSGSQFVVVGEQYTYPAYSRSATILTSPDGITWTSRAPGTTNTLTGVVWSGSQFVAVGSGGTILASSDGITWTVRTSGTVNSLSGVTWSGSQIIAVGGNGTVVMSPDGITWTVRTSGTVNTLNGVIWSGSQFVVVGEQYTYYPVYSRSGTILTSPDGITWTSRAPGTTNTLTGVVWSGSQFVAVGGNNSQGGAILTSPDGITWTARAPGTISNPVSVQIQVDDKETLTNGTTQMGSGFDPSSLYLQFYAYTSSGNGSVTGKDINLNPVTISGWANIAPLFNVSGPDINGVYTITPNGGSLTFDKGTSASMNVNLYLSLSDYARRSSWAYTSFTVQ
ncbi:MAG: hypothetical protein HYR67_00625 [Bacteroidetes bacterium]|nr:hypothetical protein [Bacteroidota bacterium]